VSDEKLWDESLTSRHLQVLYHQMPIKETPLMRLCEMHLQEQFLLDPVQFRLKLGNIQNLKSNLFSRWFLNQM